MRRKISPIRVVSAPFAWLMILSGRMGYLRGVFFFANIAGRITRRMRLWGFHHVYW